MRLLLTLMTSVALYGSAAAACPPAGTTVASLEALRASGWQVADDAKRQALAIGLQDCTGDLDPHLREQLAFSALVNWMHQQKIDANTLRTIRSTQIGQLTKPDPTGFAHPQALLLLEGVADMDNQKKILTPAERVEIVRAATSYLSRLRDYRSFDEKFGWRSALPSAATLLGLMHNDPSLGRAELRAIMQAVMVQLREPSLGKPPHFFQHKEGISMASLMYRLSRRSELTADDWTEFEQSFATAPAPDSPARLARLHNLRSFLFPFYVLLQEGGESPARTRLLPMTRRLLGPASQ